MNEGETPFILGLFTNLAFLSGVMGFSSLHDIKNKLSIIMEYHKSIDFKNYCYWLSVRDI